MVAIVTLAFSSMFMPKCDERVYEVHFQASSIVMTDRFIVFRSFGHFCWRKNDRVNSQRFFVHRKIEINLHFRWEMKLQETQGIRRPANLLCRETTKLLLPSFNCNVFNSESFSTLFTVFHTPKRKKLTKLWMTLDTAKFIRQNCVQRPMSVHSNEHLRFKYENVYEWKIHFQICILHTFSFELNQIQWNSLNLHCLLRTVRNGNWMSELCSKNRWK